jgi:hypothetical protein
VMELNYTASELHDASQSGQGIFLVVRYTFFASRTPIFTGVAVGPQEPLGPTPAPSQS